MSITQKELKEYFSDISSLLICKSKQKKAFLSELQSDVASFLKENPDADMKGVIKCFGSAETIAESFLKSESAAQVRKKLDMKKLVLLAVIAVLVIYLAFVIISLIDVHTEAHGYFEEGIMMISSVLRGGNI